MIVAAGAASRRVGRLAGVDIPVVPIKHQYVVTESFGVPSSMPTVRDPDNIVYFREENAGILVGGYIRNPEIWDTTAPLEESRTLFPPDMPKFQESWESAVRRVPALARTEITKVVHGPEAFTPDGEFLLGETPVRGLWAAAGFCVHGLAAAGGVGKVMAEWIVDGSPEYDVFGMDLRRFGTHARSASWTRAKALDSYSKYYDIVYPGEERTAARPLRRSPAWVRHVELGAAFGEKSGWERVNWYEPGGRPAVESGGDLPADDRGLRPAGHDVPRTSETSPQTSMTSPRVAGAPVRTAGRAGSGRPPYARSAWPPATPRASSTRPRSPSWRCRDPGPWRGCSGRAPGSSTGPWARSSTPSSSTVAAASRPT